MKVRLYRENEQTGKIENNDSSAWPVRIINTEFRKMNGYDSNRVYLPIITEIRMKTKKGFNPIVFRNNNSNEIFGVINIKYGFPDTIKKRSDYINGDNSIKYDKLAGRKFIFQLVDKGKRVDIRCTIINPNVADYKGYLFPKNTSSFLEDSSLIKLSKEDFLTTKEKIKGSEIDALQLKMDGLGKFSDLKREIRAAKRKKKIMKKAKEKYETKNLLAQGYTVDEIKAKKIRIGNKVLLDQKKLMKGYQNQGENNNLAGLVEHNHVKENLNISSTPLEGNLEKHDVRIDEENEEIRKNEKNKVNEDDVTEEVSFQNNIVYVKDENKKTNRKYSMEKDLERYQNLNKKHHKPSNHRMLMQVVQRKDPLCLI